MANTRIKDISTAATTLNSDDFIAVDGSTAGTRKMAKADLITEVSTGVSGTYLEESNNLSDVASKDTSKLNLEVPDVGTGPQEVPLNSMLSSMAYQSADSVSVAELEVESTTGTATTQALTVTDGSSTKFVVQEDGKVGVGGTPNYALDVSAGSVSLDSDWPLYFGSTNAFIEGGTSGTKLRLNHSAGLNITNAGTTHLALDSSGNVSVSSGQMQVISGAASAPSYAFDGDTDTGMSRPTTGAINFVTEGTERWRINASGNLVANGTAIDFGSAATSAGDGIGTTGTPANSVLSDYEYGSWVPRFEMTGVNFTSITTDMIAAQYVKIGRHVHCQAMIRTDALDVTGASGSVAVQGLPFVSESTASNYGALLVVWSTAWVNAPNTGYVQPNSSYAVLARNGTTGGSVITASDMTNGTVANANELIFTVSYIAKT